MILGLEQLLVSLLDGEGSSGRLAGANRPRLDDPEELFSLPQSNPTAFAVALERVADDREALQRMGDRGRYLAETHFDRNYLSKQGVDWVARTNTSQVAN